VAVASSHVSDAGTVLPGALDLDEDLVGGYGGVVAYLSRMRNRPYMSWVSRMPAGWADGLLAVVLAVVLVGVRALEAHGLGPASRLGYALSVLGASLLVCRRRWPLGVFAGTLVVAVLAIALASPTGAISLPVMIALYTLAQVEGRRRDVLLALLAGVALALARGLLQYRGWSDARTAVEPVLTLAAPTSLRSKRAQHRPSARAKRRRGARSMPSGCGSHESCTTYSHMALPRSTSRPASPCTCWTSAPSTQRRRC
jgi:hypothetical protein